MSALLPSINFYVPLFWPVLYMSILPAEERYETARLRNSVACISRDASILLKWYAWVHTELRTV
eukprot:scaffold542930_cov37-Prasinocladus_malaysianus.AAC.1